MTTLRNLITGNLSAAERDSIELGAACGGLVILGFVFITTCARFLAMTGGL